MKQAGVTKSNYNKIISRGEGTGITDKKVNGLPAIQVDNDLSIDNIATGLAHEFTNRKNGKIFNKAIKEVSSGTISADNYAETLINTEIEASINQVIVASELKVELPQDPDNWVKSYSEGKLTKKEMRETLKKELSELAFTDGPNKGKTAKDVYKSQGEEYRKKQKEIDDKKKNN
jgi:hypothetical protein